MKKKFYLIILLLISIFSFFIYRVYTLAFKEHNFYLETAYNINNIYVTGSSSPRGRILDINGTIIVDNVGINSIFYHRPTNITSQKEIEVAESLAKLTNYTYKYNESKLKDYYLLLHKEESDNLITPEERKLYSERKLSKKDLLNLQKERITKEDIDALTEEEKYSSYFYYLMEEGYSYDNKVVLRGISDELYGNILEANLPGIFGEIEWNRTYPFNDTLKSILGTISNSLPKEKEYLLKEGYSLQDKVGTSGLEEYYEAYLKGTKAIYKLENNNLVLTKEAKRGNDITLNIDIELNLQIEAILKEEIKKAKSLPNTEYYHESYTLISDPKTGAIKALAGLRLLDNGQFQDVSINVIKNAYTVGSAVKGASISVGYKTGAINIGTTFPDSCIKLYNNPAKCSYRYLGTLNDINALALSSNTYQFRIALIVSQNKYYPNMKAKVTNKDFETYRSTFSEFGLGTLTGIDLPGELTGLKGSKIAPDLLLNLSIGQYDLYTPVGLLQYINTIASSGTRLKLNLMHNIKNETDILLENNPTILNKVSLDEKYINRIQTGLNEVIKKGTGYWYTTNHDAAGKTGTSESFIDTDIDGIADAYVLSNTFLMYAPFNNPKYSIVVISPSTSNLRGKTKYRAPVNRLIARKINDLLLPSTYN